MIEINIYTHSFSESKVLFIFIIHIYFCNEIFIRLVGLYHSQLVTRSSSDTSYILKFSLGYIIHIYFINIFYKLLCHVKKFLFFEKWEGQIVNLVFLGTVLITFGLKKGACEGFFFFFFFFFFFYLDKNGK